MKQVKMGIMGLDCANCAAKLEREIAKIEGLKEVSINFMQEKLLFECVEEQLEKKILEIEKVIEQVEPDATLVKGEASHGHHHAHTHEHSCSCGHEHHEHHDHDSHCDCNHEHTHEHNCECGHEHHEHHHDHICNHEHSHEHGCDCDHEHHHAHDTHCSCNHEHHDEHRKQIPTQYQYLIKGLDCANCAAQLEREIAKIEYLRNVQLIFMTETLFFDVDREHYEEAMIQIRKTIQRVEPDCTLEEKKTQKKKVVKKEGHKSEVYKIVGSILFLIVATLLKENPFNLVCYAISYLLVGYPVLKTAIRNMSKKQWMDENFLMAIATIGAIGTGEYAEGVFVMLLYQIGELLQTIAVENSRRSISDLMNIRADEANVKIGDRIEKVAVEEVSVNDIIVIRPGEKVPLDGIILSGNSSLDTAALTGESLPRDVSVNDEVISGCVNMQGLLEVRVTKTADESTVAKILDLVENSSNRKAHAENFITTFAKYYTPTVVALACIIAFVCPLILPSASFSEYFHRGLVFLVVSCPCALVISVPLSYFAGIGGLSKKGILVKGSNYLDALNAVDTVVFDKTGTITKGEFFVSKIDAKENEEKLIEYCAYAEANSSHPISKAIVRAYGKEIEPTRIESVNEFAGHGVEAKIDGHLILAGNQKLMEKHHIEFEEVASEGTVVYVAIDEHFAGAIMISDQIKESAKQAIHELSSLGIRKTVMLSGDNEKSAVAVAKSCGIDEVHSELLPADKVRLFEELKQNSNCAYIGDGINDAPVLAMANVGLAMGGLGSDAAIEAADIVIMNDDLLSVNDAIKGAKKTRRIVMQNIVFSLLVKGFILILSAIGMGDMGLAIFADVGVMLLAVLNAIRALR